MVRVSTMVAVLSLPHRDGRGSGYRGVAARPGERRRWLASLAGEPRTAVFFESPRRLPATLADAVAQLGGERTAAVCRELTKIYEEVARDDLCGLARRYAQAPLPRGEIVLVVAPPVDEAPAFTLETVDALLRQELSGRSVKDAVEDVAARSGRPRREVYRRALALKQAGDANGG